MTPAEKAVMSKEAEDEKPITGREFYTDKRMAARMPHVLQDKTATIVAWDPRLALELAMLGDKPEEFVPTFEKYNIDPAQAAQLIANPLFIEQLKRYKTELEQNGLSFRQKAKILAEDLLPYGYDLATDATVAAPVRADMIQWFAKMADYEPAKANGKDIAAQGGFSMQIVFSGQAPGSAQVIGSGVAAPASGPHTIEHEA